MYRLTSLLLFMGLLGIGGSLQAEDYVDLESMQDFVFATWGTGDGNQAASQVSCAVSANTSRPRPRAVDRSFPYNFKVAALSGSSAYYLYLDGDDTNTGNARLAIQFRHRDAKVGTGYESLSEDVYDVHSHNGQFKNCLDGNNSELGISINATELAMARAGTYTGTFRAEIRGGESGATTSAQDFQASINVTDMVRISSMGNIDLGSWSGGDVNATETFCVYSNNASAAYNITITSPNQDGGSNFYVANADSSASVPYTLSFKDDTAAGAGTMVGAMAISGTGTNSSIDCGGADNAKLNVSIAEIDLSVAPADFYDDTLTLVVAPE